MTHCRSLLFSRSLMRGSCRVCTMTWSLWSGGSSYKRERRLGCTSTRLRLVVRRLGAMSLVEGTVCFRCFLCGLGKLSNWFNRCHNALNSFKILCMLIHNTQNFYCNCSKSNRIANNFSLHNGNLLQRLFICQ